LTWVLLFLKRFIINYLRKYITLNFPVFILYRHYKSQYIDSTLDDQLWIPASHTLSWLLSSHCHPYGESTTLRITNTESYMYKKIQKEPPASVIRGVGYLPFYRYGESANLHISDTQSRRLPVSTIRGVDFQLPISLRIRSQNRRGLNSCVESSAEPIYIWKIEKSVSLPCPFKLPHNKCIFPGDHTFLQYLTDA